MRILINLLIIICCFGCKESNFHKVKPEQIGEVLFKNDFNEFETNVILNYKTKKSRVIHKETITFQSSDSSYICFKKKITPANEFSLSFWFIPDFYGRNGTIINLSKNMKDFPINSSLSIFMNKNRIAIMHEGQDLRKFGYVNQAEFTDYFMSLKVLNVSEMYFVTYVYENHKIKLFLDCQLYSEYPNIPKITDFEYITLGASWDKKGGKYYFNGSIDDLYMFNKNLSQNDINNLIDYTHLYQ